MARPCKQISVPAADRSRLKALVRAGNTPRKLVERAQIILLFGDGKTAEEISEAVGMSRTAVYRWGQRYEEKGFEGIQDLPRSGRPRVLPASKAKQILKMTVEQIPREATHWSLRLMAKYADVSQRQVKGVWEAANLKPHRIKSFKISKDPNFAEKVQDVVGLYLDPPENAVVLSVDEKTQIQALDRTQPLLQLRPGQIERRTHDYKRHGTRSLYAAFDVASGQVVGRVTKRHRAREFIAFLRQIDQVTDPDLDLHLILDNSSTHRTEKVQDWLEKHPRFHLHFTPTSASWLNAVESWFSQLERRALYRGNFTSVEDLRNEIHRYIRVHNEDLAKPFKWTKSAESIIGSHRRVAQHLSDGTSGA